MNYNVDEKGYYGDFGGAYIPEMLYPNVAELRESYLKIMAEPDFKKEFDNFFTIYSMCYCFSHYRVFDQFMLMIKSNIGDIGAW